MVVGVELLARRVDLLHTVLLELIEKIPLGHLDTLDERAERLVGRSAGLVGDGLERAPQVVAHAEHVAGEVRHRILAPLGKFLFRAAAKIFHLRHRAQHPVLEFRVLGLKRFDRVHLLAGIGRLGLVHTGLCGGRARGFFRFGFRLAGFGHDAWNSRKSCLWSGAGGFTDRHALMRMRTRTACIRMRRKPLVRRRTGFGSAGVRTPCGSSLRACSSAPHRPAWRPAHRP